METATWYINGDSVRRGTSKNPGVGYFFTLSFYDSLWNNPNYKDDYIYVKAVLHDETEIVFKFRVNSNQQIASIFSYFWKNNFGSKYKIEGNTATIGVDLRDGGSISLPNMDDCELITDTDTFPEGVILEEDNLIIFTDNYF